jgi:MFS family permease
MSVSRPTTKAPRRYVSRLVPHNSNTVTVLLLCTAVAQSVTMGYDASMMNGLNILPSYTDYFNLNTASLSLNTASIWVGGMLAGLFAGSLSDWIGRKKVLLIGAVATIVGVIIQTASQNVGMFIAGRIIIGLGAGISGVAAPTYLGETAPIQWRATLLALYFDLWFAGGLISAGITYGTQNILTTWAWRIPSLLQAIPSGLCILVLPFIPESPRWLAYKDRQEEALEVLAVAHGWGDQTDPVVLTEYQEIVQTLAFEKTSGSVSPLETIRTPGNRFRLMLMMSVAIFSMTQGNNVVTYYLGTMLNEAGITNTNTQLQVCTLKPQNPLNTEETLFIFDYV